MSNAPYVKLRDLCNVNQGLQIPISKRSREDGQNRYFYITVQFLKDNHAEKFYIENPPQSSICNEDDIIIVRTGSTGEVITGVKGCFHNNFFKINFDKEKVVGKFLYYCLTSKEKKMEMKRRSGITVIPDLNHFMFLDMEIPFPEYSQQLKAVNTLDVINKKIEINNEINSELKVMSKLIYDYWFVQFDFPDKNGNPYKSSGGKMVYNEELKREIPERWEVRPLGECINLYDSLRVPLAQSEREKITGSIPYYGATGINGYVNNYLFNDDYILLAEDGSVMDDNGMPIVQFIWGKTWVNNHAHVIQALNKLHNEFIYQLVKMIPVTNIKTGSIQIKITQENLKNYKVLIPSLDLVEEYSIKAASIRKQLINNIEQNQQLSDLRDWLLPMLMNGQVTVKDL